MKSMQLTSLLALALALSLGACVPDASSHEYDGGVSSDASDDLGRAEQGLSRGSFVIPGLWQSQPTCEQLCDDEHVECLDDVDRLREPDHRRRQFMYRVCDVGFETCVGRCDPQRP